MISVLCMGVWFIAVSNHIEKRGKSRRQLPRQRGRWKVNATMQEVYNGTRSDGQGIDGYVEG
jgi:hypothetical protein